MNEKLIDEIVEEAKRQGMNITKEQVIEAINAYTDKDINKNNDKTKALSDDELGNISGGITFDEIWNAVCDWLKNSGSGKSTTKKRLKADI